MIIQGVTLNGTRVVDASIITQNLVIWLDANNSSSYSGSGTTVNDLSGNGYTNTLTGATYTMLNGVKCFDCTTGTRRVVVDGTGPTLPTSGYTYITWARLEAGDPASFRTLLYTNSPKYTPITIPTGTNTLGYWDTEFRSSGYDLASSVGIWVQYAVVGDNSSQTFYINGSQVGSPIAYGAGGTTHWGWGNNDGPSQPWGYVANMELYTAKLTQEQIQQNYYNQLPRFQPSSAVTSNLVLWYDPSFATSYPGTGTTITNLANTLLPGTMSNITWTDPYFTYNGTSSQVSVADTAALEPGAGSWTMEAWVNQTASGNDVVLGKFDPGGLSQDVGYSIRTTGTSYYAQLGSGSGSGSTLFVNSTTFVGTLNTWYQLVYVFTNGATKTLETFVNGTSIGTVSHNLASILNTSSNLYIGSYNNGEYAQWFDGRIGVTRLYNAALSAGQVLQNYNANRATYGL
jgi:hypothetical protein